MPVVKKAPAKKVVKKVVKKTALADRLKDKGAKSTRKSAKPIWDGPESDTPNGGITQSLLGRFLVCPERFRVRVIDGLRPAEGFNVRLEYGNMWHVCEEALATVKGAAEFNVVAASQGKKPWSNRPATTDQIMSVVVPKLQAYSQTLVDKFPLDAEQVRHWYNVCRLQFPIYVEWWKSHADVLARTPLFQEETFAVPYKLPSGRTVILRGKFDSVDIIGKGKQRLIYLQENKSKGDIDALMLHRMLKSGFELQTMFYLTALMLWLESDPNYNGDPIPIGGVRYNVVRRPLAGGKGSIKRSEGTAGAKCPRCKLSGLAKDGSKCPKCNGLGRINAKPEETPQEFYNRLSGIIKDAIEDNGDHYFFMRWKIEISRKDIERFRELTLDPILERLCLWYDIQTNQPYTQSGYGKALVHFRFPYNVYNPMLEGGVSDVDDYLDTGNEVGLAPIENLFPELS